MVADAEIFYFPYFEVIFHFRSSSIWGHLHLTPLYPLVKSYKLKFQIWVRSDQWLLRYSTFHILRSSSILGRLQLEVIFISHLCIILKFWIWVRSNQWLLRYSTFHILGSSSILGCLLMEVMFIWHLCILWLSPISLSFKFE